jgi:hypothetical protein
MNERIRELAEQAGYSPDMFGVGHWDMPEFKKFAELIIQECASFADEHNQQKLCEDYTLGVGRAIKKHFGVKQ